jgi:hypothetical protein
MGGSKTDFLLHYKSNFKTGQNFIPFYVLRLLKQLVHNK